jgi:hypothetical protein
MGGDECKEKFPTCLPGDKCKKGVWAHNGCFTSCEDKEYN